MTSWRMDDDDAIAQELLGIARTNAQGLPVLPPEADRTEGELAERDIRSMVELYRAMGRSQFVRPERYVLPAWAKNFASPRMLTQEFPGCEFVIRGVLYKPAQLEGKSTWAEVDG